MPLLSPTGLCAGDRPVKARAFPEGPRDFFYRAVDAQITFDTDSSGRAVSLTLHQNGANVPGKRIK